MNIESPPSDAGGPRISRFLHLEFIDAKRALDILGSATLLLLTSPIQAGIAVAVASKLGRPVIFRQRRPGRHGRPFTLLKFRTMLPIDEAAGRASDAERLTSFGRLLRSTSLDELPTLYNVLTGDMSLVGPRPLLMDYLPLYTSEQARRHEVRPGITGLAQVNGRNDLSWEERFEFDVAYVDTRSLAMDLRIMVSTIGAVLTRRGISAPGQSTMVKFGATDA